MRSLPLFGIPLALALAACTAGPYTGTVVSTDPTNYSFGFLGASDTMNTPVTVFVLSDANSNPVTSAYTSMGTANTGTTPNAGNDSKPYYNWNITSDSTKMTAARWPAGGLVRMKARSKYNGSSSVADMYVFDSYGNDMTGTSCLQTQLSAGVAWRAAGQACASPYEVSQIITAVSTVTTPSEQSSATVNYLSKRGGATTTGTSVPIDNIAATTNYYANIGAPALFSGPANTNPPTFIHKYGFDVTPNDDAHVIYYNAGDLGIARDMHCKSYWPPGYSTSNPPGKACYVTNYGRKSFPYTVTFGSLDPQVAINEAIAGSAAGPHTGPVTVTSNTPAATVAMVYDPTNAANSVQFMVYDDEGGLTELAALDNGGVAALTPGHEGDPTNSNVIAPNNCLTCHGSSSTYTPTLSGPSSITGATFLPFDPDSFVFSTSNSTYFKSAQLSQIKALNAHVYRSAPKPAVTTLLNGMYNSSTGPTDVASAFTSTYVPSAWTSGGQSAIQVYNEVVKPYCRTCHVSHDSAGGLDWGTWSNFHLDSTSIGSYVCNNNGTVPMPQSEQTQTRMWKSAARAHLVNALSIGGACAP